MEQDAALVEGDFVGGKIMCLPHKENIPPQYMSALENMDDRLFNHPVVIISEHVNGTENDMVDVLLITTFGEQGLEKRHGGSAEASLYAPIHPAPKHKNIMRHTITLYLAGYNGQENLFKHSWVNMGTSYSVPYKCLDEWRKWMGYNAPTLEYQSYRSLIIHLREKVPSAIAKVERNKREKGKEQKSKEERVKLIKTSGPWTETQCGIVKSTSRAVSPTTGALPMSVSMSERMMMPGSRSHTPGPWRDQNDLEGCRGATTTFYSTRETESCSCRQSKSISAMIPGAESHIHMAEEREPLRGSETQHLRQLGTETPGDDVQGDFSIFTTSTSADALGLLTYKVPATISVPSSFTDLSTTIGQKPLVSAPPEDLLMATLDVSAPPEVLTMATLDVLPRHSGLRDAYACKCF
ncbi:hypothetical protein QBC45DRAFT_327739 [Copromyces sp. CBS 386.78]|nr:hypothetical protein QBC45DRAFT_327739 [Copromyces sp. CBS 386.78]